MAQLLDEEATIAAAAVDAGLDPAQLEAWMAGTDVEQALEDDKTAARTPTDAALAQAHKLAEWDGGMRYTCPSYEITRNGASLSVPGFQPWAAYEVALANVAPDLERRDTPDSVEEVLRWAGTPLASKEVAEICELSVREAREALGRVAAEQHVGADGYWSLTG